MTEGIGAGSFSISMLQNVTSGLGGGGSGVFVRRDSAEALTVVGTSETLSNIEKNYLIQDITVVDRFASEDSNLRRTLLDNVMSNMALMETMTPPPPPQNQLSTAEIAQRAAQARAEQVRAHKAKRPSAEAVAARLQERLEQTQRRAETTRSVSQEEVKALRENVSQERVQQVQAATNNAIAQAVRVQPQQQTASLTPQDSVTVHQQTDVEHISLDFGRPAQTFTPVERPPVVLGSSTQDAPEIVLPGSGTISTEALKIPGDGVADVAALDLPGSGDAEAVALDLPGSGGAEFAALDLPGSGDTAAPVMPTFVPLSIPVDATFVPEEVVAETVAMMDANPEKAVDALENFVLPGQGQMSEEQLVQLEQLLMPA